MRVLVIDDDAMMRSSLADIFENLGALEVVAAVSGDEAVTIVKSSSTSFDFIMCDLQMPGSDGVDTIRELAALGAVGPIALMSGAGEAALAEAVDALRKSGINVVGTLAKPAATYGGVKSLLAKAAVRAG